MKQQETKQNETTIGLKFSYCIQQIRQKATFVSKTVVKTTDRKIANVLHTTAKTQDNIRRAWNVGNSV